MFEQLYNHFNKYITLPEEEFGLASPFFRYKKFRKHQYVLQNGDVSRCETFIVSGCTRTYEIDDKGQEHILQFGLENWWIGDMYSFLSGNPTRLNIDCIEETEVLQITKQDLEQLYNKVPKLERFFRILIQNAYVVSMQRLYSSMSKPAKERYLEFIEKYPHIHQRVPNHYIASYLGIAPQSLSRIRSESMKPKK